MVRIIGRTSLRRSPRSHQAKKYLNKGAPVLYIGSTDICNPASQEELNICIVKLVDEKYNKTVDTKIFINSQDYLRVVSSTSGKIIFCVPVDVIVTCINAHQKYIAFSASTSLNPNSNTIHMAHVFECASERQVEDLYDALLRTIEYVHSQADFRDDTSKVAPQFSKLSVEKPVQTSSFVMYHSTFQPDHITHKQKPSLEQKLAVTNHALFRNAFEYMKQGNQEKLHGLIYSEFDILCADDAGQTLLHLSVKLDKFSMCKFLINQCCSSDSEKENLRCAKDKEGMTPLHLAAIYGLKNFVKFLATDFKAVNIKDIKGRTPLHYCAGKIMHREMTHILVDHGSQIEAPELDGIKPISIEPALQKIQELSVSGAFVFINNLNFLERASKRIDSGVDIACSEKTASEPEIILGTSVHSPDSCYSPRQDNSLSSIPEQDKLRPPHYGSYSSSHEDDSLSYVTADSSPVSISDKMRHLREELSRLINLLNNSECHKYLLPQISQHKTASKLIIIAQYPLLSEDCANGIAFILRQLFKHNDKVSMMNCVENGLLKTLVRLLDSHVTIQTQAISILEEILSHNIGDKDYIAEFSELDPELLLALLQENDLPMTNTKLKHNEVYAKRLRSLSSPSELGESLKNGNSYFTKNWSRRLLIRILSRTSYTSKMRGKLGNSKITKQLIELMSCPTMEIREHAVITLANMALSYDNHDILQKYDIARRLKEQICLGDCISTNITSYHATRALVYLGQTDLPLYIFHDIKGIDEDIVYSNHERYDHLYVKATTLESIIRYLTNDPKLLWGDMSLRVSSHYREHPTTVDEREIIRFTLSLHRTFADTMIFFRLLVHRFSDPNVPPAKRHKLDIPPVHAKVCNVLCIWLEEFPWHFREEPDLLTELEEFVMALEEYGPVYYDIRDKIALKCTTVQLADAGHMLDKVTHLDQYKHCRASLMNEEVPLSVYTVSWLSALRAVIEKSSTPEQPPGFIRSLLNFKERELTSHVKALIPPSYRSHPDVLSLTKNLYENLALQNMSDREWQHLFVEAYFSHPLYKTDLFYEYDISLQDNETLSKIPVILGVNEHHFVIVNRHTHEIIGHHSLTSLQKIQWFTKPLDNVMCVANVEEEYRLVGQNPSDIELLITLMVQYMGGKIELVDNMFYLDEEDFSETDHIVPTNRHSWHANTNGYTRLAGDCPPTTPCRNSYIDISQAEDNSLQSNMLYTRSRLSLNLSSLGQRASQETPLNPLRRVHTTNDVTMAETLKLVEMIPRTSLTDRLRSFSTSITSKLDSVKVEEDSDEDLLPKVLPNDSLIGPPPSKRPIRRSPRISPKTWERGVVKIDPETAQETVIITEKCNVLYQLKSSGASTPSTPDSHLSHLRVRQMSSFKNIDTASFTKLLTESMEMLDERKRANRRNSTESTPSNLHRSPGTAPKHHTISRSKTFSHTFDKLVAASSPAPCVETPVELEQFTCLREDVNTCTMFRIRKAQENLFNPKCDCADVEHYTPCPCPPHSDLPYDFSFNYRRLDETQLLSYHREIARQLTIRDHELFANIAEVDLLEYTRKRELPMANYPSIMRCKEHFQNITNTVMTMILQCEPRDMRIKILEHFIDISHQCVLLRNFSALFSIATSALDSAAIRNLSQTWEGISPQHRALFDQFVEITQPTMNYKIYRTLMQSSSLPTIPCLSIYIRDFLSINEGNPNYLKKGLINLHKRRLLYRSLEEIRYFQKLDYNLSDIPEILTFLMSYSDVYNEEDFYFRSEILKRSGNRKNKKSGRRRGYS